MVNYTWNNTQDNPWLPTLDICKFLQLWIQALWVSTNSPWVSNPAIILGQNWVGSVGEGGADHHNWSLKILLGSALQPSLLGRTGLGGGGGGADNISTIICLSLSFSFSCSLPLLICPAVCAHSSFLFTPPPLSPCGENEGKDQFCLLKTRTVSWDFICWEGIVYFVFCSQEGNICKRILQLSRHLKRQSNEIILYKNFFWSYYIYTRMCSFSVN